MTSLTAVFLHQFMISVNVHCWHRALYLTSNAPSVRALSQAVNQVALFFRNTKLLDRPRGLYGCVNQYEWCMTKPVLHFVNPNQSKDILSCRSARQKCSFSGRGNVTSGGRLIVQGNTNTAIKKAS